MFYVKPITHPRTNNNNSTAGHESVLLQNIHACASQAPYGKLWAPRDVHVTSHFGYLILLIIRTFLSGPVRFEIMSVNCNFNFEIIGKETNQLNITKKLKIVFLSKKAICLPRKQLLQYR